MPSLIDALHPGIYKIILYSYAFTHFVCKFQVEIEDALSAVVRAVQTKLSGGSGYRAAGLGGFPAVWVFFQAALRDCKEMNYSRLLSVSLKRGDEGIAQLKFGKTRPGSAPAIVSVFCPLKYSRGKAEVLTRSQDTAWN